VRLVFGLGNPGREYLSTRHNVGFEVVEHLARREGLLFESASSLERFEGPAAFTCARLHLPDALLVRPETFMNRSGILVPPLLEWAGAGPESCLVVVDDLDLPPARLRLRSHGSSGGHNGLESIIEYLGTDRFPRLRVGIGRMGVGDQPRTDAARHVLERFTDDERRVMDPAVAEASEAVFAWLRDGDIQGCMARFHSRWKQAAEQ
jgi:PTH1 family peptidyl-tRNA hydrolase